MNKRSNDEDGPAEERQPDGDSTKKQKVTNESIGTSEQSIQPQRELMPKIPATPPEVPSTEAEIADIKRKYRYKYQTVPPRVYKSKDYQLWPQIALTVHRQQVNIHNHVYASNYMRYWFAEHEGLLEPPPKAPRSAYANYFNKQKSEWCKKHGSFNSSKDSKKIGAMWKALSKEDKQVWFDIYDKIVAQFNVNDDFWQTEAEEWGKAKQKKLEESGEEVDPDKRVALKLSGLSADDFYYYKWW